MYAVEIEEVALGMIREEMRSRGITNVMPIYAKPNDPKLLEPVDLVFSCDMYHYLNDRVAYSRSLARSLRPNGQVAILVFHPRGFVSCFLGHGTAKEVVRGEVESAGYRLTAESDAIDHQHFRIFSRTDR